MVRPAKITDIPRILEMGDRFFAELLAEKGLKYKHEDFFKYVLSLLESPSAHVLVAEHLDTQTGERGVIGTIAGIVHPWFMSFDQVMLTEQWWWVDPGWRDRGIAKRLLQELTNWGVQQGCNLLIMISLGASATGDRVTDYYGGLGFRMVESHWMKEL